MPDLRATATFLYCFLFFSPCTTLRCEGDLAPALCSLHIEKVLWYPRNCTVNACPRPLCYFFQHKCFFFAVHFHCPSKGKTKIAGFQGHQQIRHYFENLGYPGLLWRALQHKLWRKALWKHPTTEKNPLFLIWKFVPQPSFTVLLATADVGSEGKYVPKYILQWLFWIQLPTWLCQADQHSKHLINKAFFTPLQKKNAGP